MDFGGNILERLKNKSILITGSTGFLGKIFVEKVLRVQPQMKKAYLVVRAQNHEEAMQRVKNEVIENDLFNVLRDIHGEKFDSFILEKVHPVAGDISCENLGIDSVLVQELWNSVDIVVNVAATTKFFDRYDVALGTNVLGAKHALEFGRKCVKLEMLLHVSTAYVAGIQKGLILEKLFQDGETLKEGNTLNIEVELRLVEERKRELHSKTSKDTEKTAMKELGLQRARTFGWPNTYVFTKAMGEMLLCHSRGDLPLVILRPTIVTSIYKEPLPGWMEGSSRTVDSFIEPCAKGKLSTIFADPATVLDVIPGDFVVNAMIVAMTAHLQQQSIFIYQICSSNRNPMMCSTLVQAFYRYSDKNPRKGKDGKTIKRKKLIFFKSAPLIWGCIFLRYRVPKEVLHLMNLVFCRAFSSQYQNLNRKYKHVARLFDLYAPYAFFKGRFDDTNLEKLRMTMEKNSDEATMFNFNCKHIDWIDYFSNIHIPGLLKHVSKK